MDEIFDAATLAEHGYKLDENNALTTMNGDYLESVTINGKTMASAIGAEEYEKVRKNNTILAGENFSANPYSATPEYLQEEKALAEYHLKEYQNNPTETVIPKEVSESESFNEVFNEDKEKKMENGEPAYPDVQTMVEGEEGDTFLADIAPEDRDLYKQLIKERKQLLIQDPDFDAKSQKYIEETNKELDENSWYNPQNIGLHVSNIIDKGVQMFSPTGVGMEDEKNKEKLGSIDKEIRRIETPFAISSIEDIDTKLTQIENAKKALDNVSPQESLRLDYAEKILTQEKSKLEDFLGGDNLDSNIFSWHNAIEQGTRGLTGLISEVPAELMLKLDINDGEELDPGQEVLAMAFDTKNRIAEAQLKQTFLHELGTGVNESIKFIGFGKFGRQGGRHLAGKIVDKTIKGKLARVGTNVLTQAVLHPTTYTAAAEKYSGNIREVEDEFGMTSYTTDRHTYDTLSAELDGNLVSITKQIEMVKGDEQETARLIDLKNQLGVVRESLSADEPMGALGSLGYGIVETSKEAFSEVYFGRMMGKIGQKFMTTQAGKYLANNSSLKWLNSTASPLREAFNKKFGSSVMPGQRLIGSNIEEWGEEVFVQLMPTVGSDWNGYKDQVGELLTADFHQKVIAQTLVMNKGAQAIGWTGQNWDRYKSAISLSKETRAKGKATREERKQLGKTIRSLGDINQTSQQFEINLMGTGEGSFSITDYSNNIKALKEKGLFAEAQAMERDLVHKQAVAAVTSGYGEEFKKSMVKAQYNKNLSSDTKAILKQMETEVVEMLDDKNTYLNSSTIIELKSKNRFAKKSLLDIEKAQIESGANMNEINEELEKVGLTLADFSTVSKFENVTGEATFSERVAQAQKRLSPQNERYLMLETLKTDTKETISSFNSVLKDATSQKTQTYLQNQKNYARRTDDVDKHMFGSKMTAQEFKDIVAPALAKKGKTDGLSDSQLAEINKRIYLTKLADERQAKESSVSAKQVANKVDDVEPEMVEVVTPPSPQVQGAVNTAQTASQQMQQIASEDDSHLGDPTMDGGIIQDNDSIDFMLPMDQENEPTITALQGWAKDFKTELGRNPTFQDYWQSVVEGHGDKHIFDKESMEWMGNQWKFSNLGNSNWENIWKENYTDLKGGALSLFQKATATMREDSNVAQEVKESEIEHKVKSEPTKGVSASTQEPVEFNLDMTFNSGKTTVVTTKGNYAGVRYMNSEEQSGNVVYHSKEDVGTEIPSLNTESHLDVKDLLHKDKNQPGDVLNIRVSTEADWNNEKILVSVSDPISGQASSYITFSQWVKDNQPEGMSLEDFKQTEEFISKVPLFYVGAKGTDIMHVPDTDWYNALNILDTTEDTAEVDINNPSPQLLSDIEQGKKNTLALRRRILNGEVTQGTITSKEGSPFVFIPAKDEQGNTIPTKTLEEVATDSPVAIFNGVDFVDLNNEVLGDDMVILNKDYAEEFYKKAKGSSYQSYYLSPIYKKNGVQHYMAIGVLRKNEKGENQANSEDVQTAKWIMAANNVLISNTPKFGLAVEEANAIRKQVIKETGMDIRNLDNALNLVNSLISLSVESSNSVYSAFEKDIPVTDKDGTRGRPFVYALFFGGYLPIQNTNLNGRKSHGMSIKKDNGTFQVSKVAPTYQEFLRKRLSTNVMGYNMGTEQDPAFTISIQPTLQIQPVQGEIDTRTAQEKENVEVDAPITTPMSTLEDTGLTEEDLSTLEEAHNLLRSMNSLNNLESEEDQMPPTMEDVSLIEEALDTIGGLTSKSQREVVNSLMSMIVTNFDSSEVSSIGKYYDMIRDSFDALYSTKITRLTELEERILPLVSKFPNDIGIRATLSNIRATKEDTINVTNNYKEFFTKAFSEAQKRGLVSTTSDSEILEDIKKELDDHITQEMYEKDLYQSSNETIHKDKIGIKLKRIFSSISVGDTGFLGTPILEDYDMMYNAVATFLSNPLPTNPSFTAMMDSLRLLEESNPWMGELIKKLENTDKATQNGFVSNMYKYAANAKFVNFSTTKDGIDSAVWFSNANNVKQKIRTEWNNNFKRSAITEGDKLNTSKLRELIAQYEGWGDDKHTASEGEQRQWLADFGITIEDATWKDLQDGKLVVGNSGKKATSMPFSELFMSRAKGRNKQLFDSLYKYAKKNADATDLDFTTDASLVPFKDMNNIMKGLLAIESMYNTKARNITRRDGDKTVSEIVFPSFFLEGINKLVKSADGDKKYIEKLQEIAFSGNSLLLDLLLSEPEMADIFSYGEVGLMSMKNEFKKSPKFSKIDQISPIDYIFHQRAMFQDMKVEKLPISRDGFEMRVATMSTPTNSDKGRMMLVKTGVYNFFNTDLAFDKENDFAFTEELKELLYERLVVPELDRIVSPQSNNIKDYDKGASRFNMLPLLNTIDVGGVSALEYLKQGMPQNNDTESLKENFKLTFFSEISKYLEEVMTQEADAIQAEEQEFYKENGYKADQDAINNKEYLRNDNNYTPEQKKKASTLDYVLNANIHNMSMMQAIIGDPAMFYKSKGDPLSANADTQIQISKDLGINLGKRLALMIAPGVALAESQDEKYIQLFLKDNNVVAPNIEEIIGWHYGKSSLKEKYRDKTYQTILDEHRDGTVSKKDLDQLKLRFENIASFLEIENTDAQEYTTLKEHLRVLEGLGRIDKEKLDAIIKQVYVDKKPLSKQDLEMVLQPMKPVYTGDRFEKDADGKSTIKRTIYIKSSSFPLIPELVGENSPLYGLMKKMEEVEEKHGMYVRASYQSANKVGAMNNPIDPLDANDLAKLDIVDDNEKGLSPLHSLILDRQNFKIQQDVPFKSDKLGDDKVSMGTQIFKLLFGDGVSDINKEGFNGPQLKADFHKVFSTMVELNRKELIDELGLNEDYTPIDKEKSMLKLQRLLLSEAESRNFSENDMKSFGIHSRESNGNRVYYFKQPLWFSGNSNKIESMFNAIINNKIFKQKLPGNAFVVGSNNGMTLVNQEDANLSQVIYIGDYKGGTLKGTEVLAPSKIKVDGKLVDLFEKTNEGYTYLIEAEDGSFSINEEAIDPTLFENFTFRTPTSSHGSGSNIKIVGFIPAILGDLLITPSNFVTQMGQDFDIDKLTNYQYHHIKNSDGKIEKLNQTHVDEIIEKAENKFNSLLDKYRVLKKEGRILKLASEELKDFQKLLDILFEGQDLDAEHIYKIGKIEEAIEKTEVKLHSLPSKMALKLAQNEFISIHNTVYKSELPEIQKRINKVLSMDVAERQAEAIDKKATQVSSKMVNLLSPSYQMDKLISGSTGSDAIGIYAKGVTFNSLTQQMENKVRLVSVEKGEVSNKSVIIGNITSDGSFGRLKGINKNGANTVEKALTRSLAESLDERVNTGTDNEKAQILGRVGITHIKNVAVDNLLALLGVDLEINQIGKEEYNAENQFHNKAIVDGAEVYYAQYSIPYLLHSQPIIKEFFKRLKNSKAVIGEFTKDAEEKIYKELIGNHIPGEGKSNLDLTGENMVDALSGSIDTPLQIAALTSYRSLMEDAEALKELNQIVDLSNLGKSMWASKDKIEKFRELVKGESELNSNFSNVLGLLGTHNREGEGLNLGNGDYFVPTTNQGSMVGTALSLARNLFFDYYPYYNPYISAQVDLITDVIGKKNVSPEDQEFIFQEIKRFITSSQNNGIFEGDTRAEREHLFMDTEENTSLSTYVSNLLNNEKGNGADVLRNNMLVSSMSYDRGINGEPSLIKFDNTAAGNISEEDLHTAFKELLVSEESLPNKDGKHYTTRMLAQDLVSYSYLSGGVISEAIQFHKFIPIEYYDQMTTVVKTKDGQTVRVPITRILQEYNPQVSSWSIKNRLIGFTRQFFQNNPGFAKKFAPDYVKEFISFSKDNTGIIIKDENLKDAPRYVAIPVRGSSKKKADKWNLYENTVGTFAYKKVDIVGTFGMAEYEQGKQSANSVILKVQEEVTEPVQQQVVAMGEKPIPFAIKEGDTPTELLNRVINDSMATNPTLKDIATTLLELFGDKVLDTKVVLNSDLGPQGNFTGNTITINPKAQNLAEVFVHEFIHSVTSNYVNPYFDANGIKKGAPKEVQELYQVYLNTADKIKEKFPKEYKVFIDKWNRYRTGDKTITFSERELSLFYPTVNIKEYLAVSLSNNKIFIEETSKIKYKSTGISLDKKFSKMIQRLYDLIAGVENNLASQVIEMNLAFVQSRAKNDYNIAGQEVSSPDAEWAAYEASLTDPFMQNPTPPDVNWEEEGPNLSDPDSQDTSGAPDVSLMPQSSTKYTNFEIDKIMLPTNIKSCN